MSNLKVVGASMLFNSIPFLWFLPTVVLLYFCMQRRWRWLVLLLSSCVFYMYFIPKYILVLFLIILIDYAAALGMQPLSGRHRKTVLTISIIANIGILVFFKYYNFLFDNLSFFGATFGWSSIGLERLFWALPIGLSFHTFQSMSYTIEVYRRREPAERHLGLYALYVLYFPQLVAGPIERPQNIIWQLKQPAIFDESRVISGLRLMAIGFLKKIVVADQCAIVVDKVFNHASDYHGTMVVLATYLFAFQIFCDFSGYTDIARGASRILGIELMLNFDKPYFSRSISEFWRRWHISLSTWFRDYVYIPLGGNRCSQSVQYRNLMIVFLISGLWHGANWTFVVWGALHGFYLGAGMALSPLRERFGRGPLWSLIPRSLQHTIQVVFTFNLVAFAWIFFRADSLSTAAQLIRSIVHGGFNSGSVSEKEIVTSVVLVGSLVGIQWLDNNLDIRKRFVALNPSLRWACYLAALLTLIYYSKTDAQSFIYFQF